MVLFEKGHSVGTDILNGSRQKAIASVLNHQGTHIDKLSRPKMEFRMGPIEAHSFRIASERQQRISALWDNHGSGDRLV